jgi:hypothetical protein
VNEAFRDKLEIQADCERPATSIRPHRVSRKSVIEAFSRNALAVVILSGRFTPLRRDEQRPELKMRAKTARISRFL